MLECLCFCFIANLSKCSLRGELYAQLSIVLAASSSSELFEPAALPSGITAKPVGANVRGEPLAWVGLVARKFSWLTDDYTARSSC